MIQFTEKQIELLYVMSDLQHQWLSKYNTESNISYAQVLKMNHQKMTDICESCFDNSEEMIDLIFESIIKDYEQMLKDSD